MEHLTAHIQLLTRQVSELTALNARLVQENLKLRQVLVTDIAVVEKDSLGSKTLL